MKTWFRRADFIALAALLLLGAALWAAPLLFSSPGVVRVTLDGQSTFYSLDANREFTVSSDNGFNTLRIENGTVRVVATDCAELQCIRRGSISLAGESIVCLPHRLVIDIQRVKTSSLDAVVR